MNSVPLICHPSTPCAAIHRFEAGVVWIPGERLALNYSVEGKISRLRLPHPVSPARSDGLWRHTCFEAFFGIEASPAYCEFNFAPSGEWACYRFAAYRQGMASPATARPPEIVLRRGAQLLELEARIDPDQLPMEIDGQTLRLLRLAFAAVIEEHDGTLSYWALTHPPGKPDFHHADGFTFRLSPLIIDRSTPEEA